MLIPCVLALCTKRLVFYKSAYLAPGEEAYVVLIGFRFAPKLHGILTLAQAVLQLFSFASIGLAYQIGLYVTQAALLLAHKALYMVLEITHHFQVQGLNMLVLVHARYLYFYGLVHLVLQVGSDKERVLLSVYQKQCCLLLWA